MPSLSDYLNSLLGRGTQPAGPTGLAGVSAKSKLPDSPNEPAQITNAKVLLIIYNPVMDAASGRKLSETMNWSRPDDLVNGFIADILNTSGGMVRYQIAQRVEVNDFPLLADGFRYSSKAYLDVVDGRMPMHNPPSADYNAVLKQYNILQRVGNQEFDEVWVMSFPYAGFYESTMAGAGAFWCNAPALSNTSSCKRRFVIMGFSCERGVGEMLESYGHRTESILGKVFNCQDFITWAYKSGRQPATISGDSNLLQRFLCFDQIAPGKSALGTIHYAPNSTKDYDWGSPAPVQSECYDWLNFPNFKGDVRTVNDTEWGAGEIRAHHLWWLKHLPKAAGRKNGIHNNWWQYTANPNNVIV
ncbi:MAG TPA: hypothetical protein VHM28_00300 [Anaerolineales bacterium]|nr:hypothetical protein [Anaerolineales bacterium]